MASVAGLFYFRLMKGGEMSVSTMAWAWNQKCTPTEKLILLALADHANDDGRCWPGMERVAHKTGLTRRAVINNVKSLQDKQLIGVSHRAVAGFKKSNLYTLMSTKKDGEDRCERCSQRCEYDDQIDVNEVHIEPVIEPSIKDLIPFSEIVNFLNEKTGKSFKATTSKTKSLITARWKEGFMLADFKFVITNMAAQWMGDEKMEPYLRPETLFGNKFEGYLQQVRKPQKFEHLTPQQRKDEEEWTAILSPT